MLVDICKKCKKYLAISDGVCNICSSKTVKEQIDDKIKEDGNRAKNKLT